MCVNHNSNTAPKKGNGSDSNSKREYSKALKTKPEGDISFLTAEV